ncbi:hypothetical protein B0H10DRAFT_2197227 [Mycena sp. CBHHK59/15]|nr:hypothetical protein B0H10DRAFT_2197227 [Mycena sp. CBHHK59/15]
MSPPSLHLALGALACLLGAIGQHTLLARLLKPTPLPPIVVHVAPAASQVSALVLANLAFLNAIVLVLCVRSGSSLSFLLGFKSRLEQRAASSHTEWTPGCDNNALTVQRDDPADARAPYPHPHTANAPPDLAPALDRASPRHLALALLFLRLLHSAHASLTLPLSLETEDAEQDRDQDKTVPGAYTYTDDSGTLAPTYLASVLLLLPAACLVALVHGLLLAWSVASVLFSRHASTLFHRRASPPVPNVLPTDLAPDDADRTLVSNAAEPRTPDRKDTPRRIALSTSAPAVAQDQAAKDKDRNRDRTALRADARPFVPFFDLPTPGPQATRAARWPASSAPPGNPNSVQLVKSAAPTPAARSIPLAPSLNPAASAYVPSKFALQPPLLKTDAAPPAYWARPRLVQPALSSSTPSVAVPTPLAGSKTADPAPPAYWARGGCSVRFAAPASKNKSKKGGGVGGIIIIDFGDGGICTTSFCVHPLHFLYILLPQIDLRTSSHILLFLNASPADIDREQPASLDKSEKYLPSAGRILGGGGGGGASEDYLGLSVRRTSSGDHRAGLVNREGTARH